MKRPEELKSGNSDLHLQLSISLETGDQQGKEKLIAGFTSGRVFLGSDKSIPAAATITWLLFCYRHLFLFHSDSSREAAPALNSTWRNLYAPRSLARPLKSQAGASPRTRTAEEGWSGVDSETGTQTCNQWAWELSALCGERTST